MNSRVKSMNTTTEQNVEYPEEQPCLNFKRLCCVGMALTSERFGTVLEL